MKQQAVSKLVAIVFLSTMLLLGWTGCKKDDGSRSHGNEELSVFDFSTKADYTLNVKYNVPKDSKVYIEIYAENPLTIDANGLLVKKSGLEAVDKGYTDENGVFSNRIVVPSFVQTLYIYAPNVGAQQLLMATVNNGVLSDAQVVASNPDVMTTNISTKAPENLIVTYRGILLFEDIWPYRGDFDMNDVVIKYVSNVEFNANNEVVKTVEEFTPLSSGASLNNSFAYQNPNLASATVTFAGGDGAASVDNGDKTIIRLVSNLLESANQAEKKTVTVTTRYTTPILRINFKFPPYNPFITVSGETGHEVHLTNMKPTSYANSSMLGTGHDRSQPGKGYYYITFDEEGQQMPFAIDVTFAADEDLAKFTIPAERKKITVDYPNFMGWILSEGKLDQDWYLYPQK